MSLMLFISPAGVLDSSQRYLDRFMAPLLANLKLRSSIYDDPSHHLDQATLLIQRASDAMDSQVSVTLLERAVKRLIQASEEDPQLAAISVGLSPAIAAPAVAITGETGGLEGKRLIRLWTEVARLAAKHRATGLVSQAAGVIRALTWRVDVNREMVISQSEIDLLLADAAVLDIAKVPLLDDELLGVEEDEDEEEKVDEEVLKAIDSEASASSRCVFDCCDSLSPLSAEPSCCERVLRGHIE